MIKPEPETAPVVVKERPILFSGEMVRAILDGRKTQTRRVCKHQWEGSTLLGPEYYEPVVIGSDGQERPGREIYGAYDLDGEFGCKCPYRPGMELWVRETWRPSQVEGKAWYAATCGNESHERWKPSIYMPRWASRIQLRVTDVRVERVQEISEMDALAEGIELDGNETPFSQFVSLWDSINASRGFGWVVNPWVWVVEFNRTEKNHG